MVLISEPSLFSSTDCMMIKSLLRDLTISVCISCMALWRALGVNFVFLSLLLTPASVISSKFFACHPSVTPVF